MYFADKMAPRGASKSVVDVSEDSVPSAPVSRKQKTLASEEWKGTSVGAPFHIFGGAVEVAKPPAAKPKFSVKDIRAAIPAHCFQRSALKSSLVVLMDFVKIGCLGYAATHIQYAPEYARIPLWILYWLFQGFVMTGVWVMAHECGHQSYSSSKFINDTVGWFLHSALLVPYHSWRISHAKHHKNTCSVEHDEVFAPSTRSMASEMVSETPLAAAFGIFVMLTFGWPGYLIANMSGPAKYINKSNSHFNPYSALFADVARQWWEVLSSDVGFFGAIGAIIYASQVFGFQTVAAYYLIPYLVVNADLVLITFLQHTDYYIPHYRDSEFDWLRGALSTVDRSFGWVMDHLFHHIADTHVVHHLFHEMPFYHAQEATKHVRAVLGDYYLRDDSPIPAALWRSWATCKFVEDDEAYCYYKGLPTHPNSNLPKSKGKASKKTA